MVEDLISLLSMPVTSRWTLPLKVLSMDTKNLYQLTIHITGNIL
jgi:hypothetical protein